MTEQRKIVFGKRVANERLPEWANSGVVIIEWLRQQGLWEKATDRLRIQREGGYAGIDALVFFIYYFASGLRLGVKEFSDHAREFHKQLAAVGQRQRLPTQASISRILAAADTACACEFGSWLLQTAPGVTEVLRHPSVLTRDGVGEGWHVFDWDPTVTTLRHRALPVFDGMPEGRRRSEALAKPGYPGRKRGDVQFSRATLQHAGSGLWLGIEMSPGNGTLRGAFQSALRQVVAACEQAEVPMNRTILRADGAAGNVPFITACAETGVRYITRLAHYRVFQNKSIVEHLNDAVWFDVPSSGSGPTRQAADLGRVVLEPAPNSLQADGTVFEPIETRVVVSRFPRAEDGRGAGVILDGWQYELYGTDLSPTAWSEIEIVAGYYGRTGQENRFFQEDRELGLDRIFSYHLPGQQLATLIGLFVWNFFICRGMDLANPTQNLPEQKDEHSMSATEMPQLPIPNESIIPDGAAANCTATANAELSDTADSVSDPIKPALQNTVVEKLSNATVNDASHNPTDIAELSSDALRSASSTDSPNTTRGKLVKTLDAVDWASVLKAHKDWSWFADNGSLRCPAKALLPLVRIEQTKGSPIRVRFQANLGTCDSCKSRGDCINSDNPIFRKEVRLPIPAPHAELLRSMWLSLAKPPQPRPPRRNRTKPRPIRRIKPPLKWQPLKPPLERPKLAVAPPVLLPAELRKISRMSTRCIEAHVLVDLGPVYSRPSPVLAFSSAERQKRRLTWHERICWNELPEETRVEIRLLGAGDLQRLLAATTDHAAELVKSA